MKNFVTLVTFATAVAAAPWQLINKRALGDQAWTRNKRDGCPAYLETGQFEFPHYITQVSKANPDKAYGPQYNGVFTPNDIGSIFSFDVPASRADANCTLEFLFPKQSQLKTSSYTYSGGGSFFFKGYVIVFAEVLLTSDRVTDTIQAVVQTTKPHGITSLRQARSRTSVSCTVSRLVMHANHHSQLLFTWNPVSLTQLMSGHALLAQVSICKLLCVYYANFHQAHVLPAWPGPTILTSSSSRTMMNAQLAFIPATATVYHAPRSFVHKHTCFGVSRPQYYEDTHLRFLWLN